MTAGGTIRRTETGADLAAVDLACRRGERLVFAGLSFRLAAGGALVLRGANGSGKTSLLRLLAGLIAPAAGRLTWGGTPIDDDLAGHRARLHYVGHQDGVKPGLTPRETLVFWAALRGCDIGCRASVVDAALAAFALEPVADWPCRWLSAGQRRRPALAHDNQTRLERAIAAHRRAGGRVVLATHLPIEIGTAVGIELDAFAPRH